MCGLTGRDHVPGVLLCNLIGASKMCVAIVDRNYTQVIPTLLFDCSYMYEAWEPGYLGGVVPISHTALKSTVVPLHMWHQNA